MTTLPQTTPMRLPRPNGQGQLMIPSPATVGVPNAIGGGAAGGNQLSAGDVWRVIRANLWLIIGTVIVSLIIGFGVNFYLLKYHAAFTSFALIRVETAEEITGKGVAWPQAIELEQRTQQSMLMHEGLWSSVLANNESKIRQTGWFQQFSSPSEALEDLEDHLDVQAVPNSRLIRVAMQFRVPADSKTIVEEIVSEHIKRQKTWAVENFIRQKGPLQETVNKYEEQVRSLTMRIKDKSKNVGPDGMTVPQLELGRLLEDRVETEGKRTEAVQQLQFLQQLLNNGGEPPQLHESLSRSNVYGRLLERRADLASGLRGLEGDVGAGSPRYLSLQRQLEGLDGEINDLKESMKATIVESLKNEYLATIQSCEKQLQGIDERRAEAQAELQKIQSLRTEVAALEAEADLKREAMEKTRQELDELSSQVIVGNKGAVDWATHPETPDRPSFPELPITLSVAGVLGLALALGIAFLRELTDTSVRSPRDIARVGQINLLGMIPHQDDDPQSAGARLPVVIFDAPQSALAEQFRQVRTRLQHAASLDTTRSILVTGASAGDGKTTVSCNLAAGLALNGRKILLVDANFRRPELHRIFETGNDTGFSDVLDSLDRFDDCTRETQVPNLSVLTSGPRPANPTELLESQLLIDFIERALEEYDHVIFDSGPLPLVSETIALAPRVDGVVTVVRAQANSRGLVQRVRDTLRQIKAEHLGMILNAVRSQAGGYYGRNILEHYKYQNGQ